MPEIEGSHEDEALLSFVVASADMRYIEICRRDIYLVNDKVRGLLIQGELSGCGSDCCADLGQIFLEYVTSCEDCSDPGASEKFARYFGEKLGKIYSERLRYYLKNKPTTDQLAIAYDCILNSLDVPFGIDRSPDRIHYQMEYPPISHTAKEIGLTRGEEMAELAFRLFCESVLSNLSSEWKLLKPSHSAPVLKLREIEISSN